MANTAHAEAHKFFEQQSLPAALKFAKESWECADKAQEAFETLVVITPEGQQVDTTSNQGTEARRAFVSLYKILSRDDGMWLNMIDSTLLPALEKHNDFIGGPDFQKMTKQPLTEKTKTDAIERSRALRDAVYDAAQLAVVRIAERGSPGEKPITLPPPRTSRSTSTVTSL